MGNDTETLTLTDFLLARIAEDEALAKACTNPSWAWADTSGRKTIADMEHVDRHSPERVLAECEAKRRIVALHPVDAENGHCCVDPDAVHLGEKMYWGDPCETLSAVAAVYADHPDYRNAWRP